MPEREATSVLVSVRIGETRNAAINAALKKLPYVTSKSALFDRAIDLLIADMKKKGEIR